MTRNIPCVITHEENDKRGGSTDGLGKTPQARPGYTQTRCRDKNPEGQEVTIESNSRGWKSESERVEGSLSVRAS